MSIPDSVVGMYARLCTDLPPGEVDELAAGAAAGGPAANAAKRTMARSVVALYHGPAAAAQAEERFDAVFKRREQPTDAPIHAVAPGDPVHLPALLVASGLVESASAGRRAISGGAVRIDGQVVPGDVLDRSRADLDGVILALGRRRAVRLTI